MGTSLVSSMGSTCPYDIGDILQTTNSKNPSERWNGTQWQAIETFLLGASSSHIAGSTGGEEKHTLAENELPVIDGEFATAVVGNHSIYGTTGHAYGAKLDGSTPEGSRKSWLNEEAQTQYGYGYKFGGGQPHNNMPPYTVVYIWERTA